MKEIVILVAVLWVGYKLIQHSKGKKVTEECYALSVKFGVPEQYFWKSMSKDLPAVKKAALFLAKSELYKNYAWPRLMACAIYGAYRQDCEQYAKGNPVAQQYLDDLKISPLKIYGELNSNPLKHRY